MQCTHQNPAHATIGPGFQQIQNKTFYFKISLLADGYLALATSL
jgi:hypothetical protein